MSTGVVRTRTVTSDGTISLDTDQKIQSMLEVIKDPSCRQNLEATTDAALSTREVSDVCDLPLSTAYRKLDDLMGVGLVEERTRIHRRGKHASVYTRKVENVCISLDGEGGISCSVSKRDSDGNSSRSGDNWGV